MLAACAQSRTTNSGDLSLATDSPAGPLIIKYLHSRPNTNTAASSWLFPATMPHEHLQPTTLLVTLRQAGIPVRAARNTTWQQLVRDAPPQVLANALGIMARLPHSGQGTL